jgi:hypothetical protein
MRSRRKSAVVTQTQLVPVTGLSVEGEVPGFQVKAEGNRLAVVRMHSSPQPGALTISVPSPVDPAQRLRIELGVNGPVTSKQLANAIAEQVGTLRPFQANANQIVETRDGTRVEVLEARTVTVARKRRKARSARRRKLRALGISPERFNYERSLARKALDKTFESAQDRYANLRYVTILTPEHEKKVREAVEEAKQHALARFELAIEGIDIRELAAHIGELREIIAAQRREEGARTAGGPGWAWDFVVSTSYLKNADGLGMQRSTWALAQTLREAGVPAEPTQVRGSACVTIYGDEAAWDRALQALHERFHVPVKIFDDDARHTPKTSAVIDVGQDVRTDRGVTEYAVTLLRKPASEAPAALPTGQPLPAIELDALTTEIAAALWQRKQAYEIEKLRAKLATASTREERSEIRSRIAALERDSRGTPLSEALGVTPPSDRAAPGVIVAKIAPAK